MNIGLACFQRLILLAGLTMNMLTYTIFIAPPLYAQQSQLNDVKPTFGKVPSLPSPRAKVTIAVQKFRNFNDQSIQINHGLNKTNVLPVVDVNYTNIILEALDESGWFITSEHSNFISLLYKRGNVKDTLTSMVGNLIAPSNNDFYLESGILAYDVNTITDEKGVQYFGKAGKKPYQKGSITVYLRLISTQSGKILKTIYKSKTIFSQPVDVNSFQFVIFKRPFEAETGIIPTSSGQFVVTEAIKEAVQGLIIEGIRDGLWSVSDSSALATTTLLQKYEQETRDVSENAMLDSQPKKDLFGIRARINAPFISVHPYLGGMRYSGDYTQRETKGTYGLSLEMYLGPRVGIQVNGATGKIASKDAFSVNLTSLEANVILRPLAYQRWTPLLSAGAGIVSRSGSTPFQLQGEKYGQAQGGIGVQFSPTSFLGFRTMLLINQPFTDSLDGKIMGSHKDYYTRLTMGLVFHIGRFLMETRSIKFTKVTP